MSVASDTRVAARPPRADRWSAPADPREVRGLREHVRNFALAHGAEAPMVAELALAVSEGVTNAVQHAFVERSPGTVTVACEAAAGEIRVEITDNGRGMMPRSDSPGMGLGLATMGRVATRMDVREGPSGVGTTVSLAFRAPQVVGPVDERDAAQTATARLLAAASDLASGAAWPEGGFERLCDLALPAVADVAVVDVSEQGCLRRLAARVHDDGPASARLAADAPPLKPGTATWAAVNGGGPQLVVHDPTVARAPTGPGATLDLGWWLAVPLLDAQGSVLAVWGLGGRGGRPVPEDSVIGLLTEAAARAAAGLESAQVLAGLRDTRHRLQAILASLGEAVSVQDAQGRLLYANPAITRICGMPTVDDVLRDDVDQWFARFRLTHADGAPIADEDLPGRSLPADAAPVSVIVRSVERASGRTQWLRLSSQPVDDPSGPLTVTVMEDVTDGVRATQHADAMRRVGAILDAPAPLEAVLRDVAAALAPIVVDGCAIDLLDADGALVRMALAHPDAAQRARFDVLDARWPTATDPPSRRVVAELRPLVVPQMTDAFRQVRAQDGEHLAHLREIDARSLAIVPLRRAGVGTGLLVGWTDQHTGRALDPATVALLEDLGRRVGAAVAPAAPA